MKPGSLASLTPNSELPSVGCMPSEPIKTPKAVIQELLCGMSEEATFEEIVYEIETLAGILRGIEDADAGRTISHDEMREQAKKWFMQ